MHIVGASLYTALLDEHDACRLYPQHLEAKPAYCQPGRGLRSQQEAARSAASSAVEQDALADEKAWPFLSQPQNTESEMRESIREPPSVQQLHRLLLLEESAMEADICRCAKLACG